MGTTTTSNVEMLGGLPGYDQYVHEKWGSLDVQGWGGYLLQQKLKMSLKEWHQRHTQNTEGKIRVTPRFPKL